MYKNSFSLENRKENAVLASVHFNRFENVIKIFIPIFVNQLWTVTLNNYSKLNPLTQPNVVYFIAHLLHVFIQSKHISEVRTEQDLNIK